MTERAELTLIKEPVGPGWWRAPGDCTLTKLDDGRIRVDQADPRIWISRQLLEEIKAEGYDAAGVSISGGLLRIEGVNRTVIYRIGEQVPDQYAYYAEFPD